tara:strand:+ start:90 stop:971 length:882 start_codon:yes stop_codon:yes gene_type:complete
MANDFSNVLETAVSTFYTTLGEHTQSWRKWAAIINDDSAVLQRADLYNLSNWAPQTATPTANDIKSSKNTVTRAVFEKLVTVNEVDLMDSPSMASDIAAMMAQTGAYKIGEAMYTALQNAESTDHPDPAYAGSGKKFIDSFSETVTQSNETGSPLSSASLTAAIAAMANYKDKAGLVMDATQGGLCLVVPPALAAIASDLVAGTAATASSDLASFHYRFGDVVTDVAVSGLLSDTNNWYLASPSISPVKAWIRKSPQLRISPDPSSGRVHFYGSLQVNAVLEPFEGGLYGGIV